MKFIIFESLIMATIISGVCCKSPPPIDDVNITHLEVPTYVKQGDDAELGCEYESSLQMYSMKWYRNDREFFYFIPTLKPSKRIIPLPGIDVDVERSTGQSLILRRVDLDTEGRYKCEVSTEWPHYYTADRSRFMTVVVLPDDKPEIYGASERYRPGDQVHLTCNSAPSNPRAELTWYINEKKAPAELVVPKKPRTALDSRLEQSILVLKFVVQQSHFHHGTLALKCSSVVASHLLKGSQRHILHAEIAINFAYIDTEERAALAGHSSSAKCLERGEKNEFIFFAIYIFIWTQILFVT